MAFPRLIAKAAALALFVAPIAGSATAREFWIDPLDYTVAVGDPIEARLKNGQNFKGSTFPYLDELFTRFEVATRKGVAPVKGRRGDNPALDQQTETGGLHTVVYEGTMLTVTYTEYEKFEDFVTSKKLDWVLEAHKDRGLPTDRIVESYYRYPKSLIKVGSGAGRDQAYGLPFELVAEINPYTAAADDGVRVRLLYLAEPVAGADIQIFHYPDGEPEAVKDHVTNDATGRATVPVFDRGAFLINATMMKQPRDEGLAKGAVWESLWASMTYELPK